MTDPEDTLFPNDATAVDGDPIGAGWVIRKTEAFPPKVILYRFGTVVKVIDISDKTAKRLLVVELVEEGVIQSRLAKGLGISRQSIHNYLETQKHFGREGLVHGYSSKKGSGLTAQRRRHSGKRDQGNKAKATAAIRRRNKVVVEQQEQERQGQLNYSFGHASSGEVVVTSADPHQAYPAAAEQLEEEKRSSQAEELKGSNDPQEAVLIEDEAVKDKLFEIGKDGADTRSVGEEEGGEKQAIMSEKVGDCQSHSDAENTNKNHSDHVKSKRPEGNVGPFTDAEVREAGKDLFDEEHDWHSTRFAGVFCYLISLISEWKWLHLVLGYFGKSHQIFSVFLLMAARNIRSIEQLKNQHRREAGLILGLGSLPSRTEIWKWFYNASRLKCSSFLLFDYFRYQIRMGLVSLYSWFTDGHLLPYTGWEKLHKAFNTQRKMPVPGQTNLVTCDDTGRVVDFEIQEGKGDLRGRISALFRKWKSEFTESPVMVFDREGHGAAFFLGLIRQGIAFATWEKHIDKAKLSAISDDKFTEEFTFNGKIYRVFEGEKSFSVDISPNPEVQEMKTFTVRRIYIWNVSVNRRTCGLTWSGSKKTLSMEDCARLILSRWGASENTFKHLQDRHPLHYHPGFSLSESDNQEIANPEIKAKAKQINQAQKVIDKLSRALVNTKEKLKKDGSPRKNDLHRRLSRELNEQKEKLKNLHTSKEQLPSTVNLSSLSDYRSFKKIDNEGKNLFDFVTTSVWNARKQMVDLLRCDFDREAEVVDLFYAITECHGWIKSTATEVRVRLEPVQISKRRAAQEQFCRKLTGQLVQLPNGKWLAIEVGESPRTD